KSNKVSPRQLRQLDFIGQFTTQLVHVSGEDNVVADALSRIEELITPSLFDNNELAQEQEQGAELQRILQSESTGLVLKKFTLIGNRRVSTVHINRLKPAFLLQQTTIA